MNSIWTSRDVHFKCDNQTTDEAFERLFDAAPEHYWGGWRRGLLGTVSIASTGLTLEIAGWPWWVPRWVALRSVAALASREGIGGGATFRIERNVLTESHFRVVESHFRVVESDARDNTEAG